MKLEEGERKEKKEEKRGGMAKIKPQKGMQKRHKN